MKYLIPYHTKCIISVLAPDSNQLYGTKKTIKTDDIFTEFPVILTNYKNPRNLLPDGWVWVVRLDGGICIFNSNIFIDFDKQDVVPL